MADKGWKNNGEKVPRRSPRKRSPIKRVQIITETQAIGSDTTGCTPDILKSPEITHTRVPGSKKTDGIERRVNAGRKAKFKGVTYVPETEQQSTSSDSEDEVPVAQLLKTRKPGSLTLEEIQYCMEGP